MKRIAVVVLMAAGLGGCGSMAGGHWFDEAFWASSPAKQNIEAELGLAELAKGNYVTAEGHFQKALKANKQDVYALLGQGLLYHNTGQTTKAREMYEAVLAIRPKASDQMVVWTNLSTRPVSEIASVNLALLESGGVLADMGRGPTGPGANGTQAASMRATPAMAANGHPVVSGASNGVAILGRPVLKPSTGEPNRVAAPPMEPKFADADSNIVGRFATLKALRDQGLITPEEYKTRRRVNIGALLPLTSPPPPAGLDRPVPTTAQISGRLRAIGRALEMRAMSVSQHASERSMILDALMPAAPVNVANPGRPPQGLMEAADRVRKLEQLKEGGFITSDEYTRERQAIELAMQPKPSPAKHAAAAKKPATPAKTSAAHKGPQTAVHLASYRTRKAAKRGWVELRRTYGDVLSGLSPEVARVNLGPGKGIFYRLKAGPINSKAAADTICRKLKAHRQYCQPTYMDAG